MALGWALSSGVRALSRPVAKLCWTRYLYARVESGIIAPVERDMKGSLRMGAFRTSVYSQCFGNECGQLGLEHTGSRTCGGGILIC